MFSISKLKHVMEVDRARSFTGAAEALCVTQSAVTKSVADIERMLGYFLFKRNARGIRATAEGREFTDRSSWIVSDMNMLAALRLSTTL